MEDVLTYMGEYIRLGQNSKLLKKEATEDDMKAYSAIFCRMLGSIYENLQTHKPIFINGLICQPFHFGGDSDIDWLKEDAEKALHSLVYEQIHEQLRTVRIVRFYKDNVMLIIKPDRLRYWIRSTAIRDADETLADLRKQGY